MQKYQIKLLDGIHQFTEQLTSVEYCGSQASVKDLKEKKNTKQK